MGGPWATGWRAAAEDDAVLSGDALASNSLNVGSGCSNVTGGGRTTEGDEVSGGKLAIGGWWTTCGTDWCCSC
eukprot:scaffold305482_cov36-Tisochrysis_lutea.AAC.3